MELQNRPVAMNRIWNNLATQTLNDFDIKELKNLLSKVINEDRFDVKCFQSDRALACIDFLKLHTMLAEDDADLSTAYDYSQELYQVIYKNKDKILSYDAGESPETIDQGEQDLIDLLILTEVVSYSVLSLGLAPTKIDNQSSELSNSVERVCKKMGQLSIS